MLGLLFEICTRSWRQYLSCILALIVATVFIFLQLTAPAFLDASLAKSVAKTVDKADAVVVQSALPRDELIQKLNELPQVANAQARTSTTMQAITATKAITTTAISLSPSSLSALALSEGNVPAKSDEILLSVSAARYLNIRVGERLNLVSVHDNKPKMTKVVVTGLSRRSPFAQDSRRFEVYSPNLAALSSSGFTNQRVSIDNAVEVEGKDAIEESVLIGKISATAAGQVLSKSSRYSIEHREQVNSTEYLESSIRWLFNIPTLLCIFVLIVSLRKIMKNRHSLSRLFSSLGYSWHKLALIIAGEILLFTLIATAIGIAVGRALSEFLSSFLHTKAIGFFTADFVPTNVTQFLFTLIFTLLLALFAIGYAVVYLYSFERKTNPQQHISSPEKDFSTRRNFEDNAKNDKRRRGRKKTLGIDASRPQLGVFALELILFAFISAIGIYYVVIISENLLRVAAISVEAENLRHLTRITLIVIFGMILFGLIHKVFQLLSPILASPVFVRKYFSSPRNSFKLSFLYTPDVRFSALFVIGISAAILALATTAHIGDTSFHSFSSKATPYDMVVERTKESINFDNAQTDEEIQQLLEHQRYIENVAKIESFTAQIKQNGKTLVENAPFLVTTENLTSFVNLSKQAKAHLAKADTVVLPESYSKIYPHRKQPIQLNLASSEAETLTSTSTLTATKTSFPGQEVEFNFAFANLPWPMISAENAAKLRSTYTAALDRDPNSSPASAFFWVRFHDANRSHLADAYTQALKIQEELPYVQFTLATQPIPEIRHNYISTAITTVLLSFTLIFILLNLATVYLAAIGKSQKQFRLALMLGISRQQIIRSVILKALATTGLAATFGALVGIVSGLYLAKSFITELPVNLLLMVPWASAGAIIVVSLLFVGVSLWLRLTALPRFSNQYLQIESGFAFFDDKRKRW